MCVCVCMYVCNVYRSDWPAGFIAVGARAPIHHHPSSSSPSSFAQGSVSVALVVSMTCMQAGQALWGCGCNSATNCEAAPLAPARLGPGEGNPESGLHFVKPEAGEPCRAVLNQVPLCHPSLGRPGSEFWLCPGTQPALLLVPQPTLRSHTANISPTATRAATVSLSCAKPSWSCG